MVVVMMVMVTVARALPFVPSVIKFGVDAGQDGCAWPDHFLRERELLAVEYESCSILRDRLFSGSQGVVELRDTRLHGEKAIRARKDPRLDRVIDVVIAGGQFLTKVLDTVE